MPKCLELVFADHFHSESVENRSWKRGLYELVVKKVFWEIVVSDFSQLNFHQLFSDPFFAQLHNKPQIRLIVASQVAAWKLERSDSLTTEIL